MASRVVRFSAEGLGPRLRAWWRRLQRIGGRAPRRLRMCESVALGERRFVAVIAFDQTRFLVGGTASSLVLLARLGNVEAEGLEADESSSGEAATAGPRC